LRQTPGVWQYAGNAQHKAKGGNREGKQRGQGNTREDKFNTQQRNALREALAAGEKRQRPALTARGKKKRQRLKGERSEAPPSILGKTQEVRRNTKREDRKCQNKLSKQAIKRDRVRKH